MKASDDDHLENPLLRNSPTARRLQQLSRLMDSSIVLPGGFRIGWDAVIGLIPGIGDLAGLFISVWIVYGAARLGAPRAALLRMSGNIAIESIIGTVPLIGDLFDMAFKANIRNMRLLDQYMVAPRKTVRQSRAWLIGWALAAVALVLLVGWLILVLLGAIFGWLF